MLTSDQLASACNADGEFRLAARRWHGAVRLTIGDGVIGLSLRDGVAAPWSVADLDVPSVHITGSAEAWQALLAPRPERFLNDLMPAIAAGAFTARRRTDVVAVLPGDRSGRRGDARTQR